MSRSYGVISAALLLVVLACAPTAAPTTSPTPAGQATDGQTGVPTEPPSPTTASLGSPPPTGVTSPPTEPPASTTPGQPSALSWTELTASGGLPAAREDHTWTVAADGQSAYLFGGRSGRREFNDLWRYDLATNEWTELQPGGDVPQARFGHTAIWVDGIGLVIWSGQAGTSFFADSWAYDPQQDAWRELAGAGDVPPARYGSCAALGPDGRMWISHGFTEDSGRFSDTRVYDFASGSWSDVTPSGERPVERCLHDCLWTPDGRLVVYAGQTTGAPAIGDLWTYDFEDEAWTRAARPEPNPRQLYALAHLRGTAFVFGGAGADGNPLDDLWQLELAGLSWTQASIPEPLPPARFGASLIADAARNRLLLFGGKRGDEELGDVWELALRP